jgi:hypothetical protein
LDLNKVPCFETGGVECILVALDVVGFMNDMAWGRGGFVPAVLPVEGVLFTVLPVTLAVFGTLVLLRGTRLTVLVEAELFNELLELTILFLELDLWTLDCESVLRKLLDLRGITLFFCGSWTVRLTVLARSRTRPLLGGAFFRALFVAVIGVSLLVVESTVLLLSRDDALIGLDLL